MLTPEKRAARRKIIAQWAKRQKLSVIKKQYWEERRQRLAQHDEPKDTTIETAGNADYDIQELPDLVLEG